MELLINLVGVLVGLATVAGTVFAYIKGLGKRDEKIGELRRDVDRMETRLTKTEESAIQTSKLADAVEHMGEKFAGEIKRLVDIWELTNAFTREQLSDIKDQLNRKVGE